MTVDQRLLRRIAGLFKARLPDAMLDGLDDPREARGRRWRELDYGKPHQWAPMLAGRTSFAEAEALSTLDRTCPQAAGHDQLNCGCRLSYGP